MQTKTHSRSILWELLDLTGRWYPSLAIFFAQLISLPAALVGVGVAQVNASYPSEQLRQGVIFVLVVLIISNIAVLVANYFFTRNATSRLNTWSHGENLQYGTDEEKLAWDEISWTPWRYTRDALISASVIVLLPTLIYFYLVLDATNDQLIYTLFGGIVAALITVIITILLLEQILGPARQVLFPHNFDAGLAGNLGFRLVSKFQFIIISILVIVVLILAPLGYNLATKILFYEVNSAEALRDLQVMLLIGSGVAILIGIGISSILAWYVSQPLRNLVGVFEKAEKGDLDQRAEINTVDETGALALSFNGMIERLEGLQRDLEKQVGARTAQLEATSEISRIATSTLDVYELAAKVVNLITDKFGHYYAAMFLIDDTGAWANLIDATGDAGRLLKERRHRLPLPGKSMVSYAILNLQPRVALNVVDESVRYENPFLANTRSEISVPLIVGNRALGALNIQSQTANAFSQEDINTFQNIANQVAVAIQNANLFRSTQELLEEMRSTSQQFIPLSWSDLNRAGGVAQFETRGIPFVDEEIHKAEIPLYLRDQALGSIVIEGDEDWSAAEKNLAEAIAAQAAFALENARLLSESQQTALRERLASAIVERIWSAQTLEGILQTTIRELGRALEASEATIEIKVEEENRQ